MRNKLEGVIPAVSAWSGVIGFPAFFALLTIAGLLRPGYSPISQYGSDLGVGSGAWIFDVSLIAYGVLLIVFAVGFYRAMDSVLVGRRSTIVTILLVLAGAGGLTAGTFSEASPILHAFGGLTIFGLPPIAQILAGTKLRAIPGMRWYVRYTTVNGVVAMLMDVFDTFYPALKLVPSMIPLAFALETQYTGILQRTQMIVTWSWYTISGIRSVRLGKEVNAAISHELSARNPGSLKI